MATTYDKASLVMIPSGYKDDKLYSVKPTDGSGDFTFSRDGAGASPATRVNASGLIEKGRENLLDYSNDFSNWTLASVTPTSGQSGYDGSSDAWELNKTSTGGAIINPTTLNGVATCSVYAKAGTLDFVLFFINYNSGTDTQAYFDLSTGSVGTTIAAIDSNITSLGGGWYRCDVSFNCPSTLADVRIFPAIADNDSTGTGTIYIQDAQLEQGLVATDYIETTTAPVSAGLLGDMPRLDYSGGATCPSLLLEPSRVNSVTQSEYLNGLPDVSNVVVTTNATTSPEGVVNASKVVASAANTFHWVGINTSVSNGIVYTASVFAKAAEYENLFIVLRTDSGAKRYGVKFNLTTGTFVDDITFGSPTQTDYDIEDYGNGWYRCSVSSYHTSGNIVALFGPSLGGALSDINNSFLGDGTSGIYMYGTQAENGAYMTSLIPTYGSASTRGVDFSESVFTENTLSPTGGTTLFIEFESSGEVDTAPNTGGFYLKNNAGTLSHFGMSFGYGDRIYSNYQNGSTIQWDGSIVENTTHKVAFQFTQGGKSFLDGTTKATTSVDWSTKAMGQFELQYGSKVKQAILFPSILTDAECIALTTL